MNPVPNLVALPLTGLLALAVGPVTTAQQPSAQFTSAQLTVFDVPLGGTLEQVERMATQRGYRKQARPTHCAYDEICLNISNLEGHSETDFVNQAWGQRKLPDRRESVRFVFAAPPNRHQIFSAASDQEFGTRWEPGPAAPLTRDVLQALVARYGRPVATYAGDGAKVLPSSDNFQYWWFWNSEGKLVPGSLTNGRESTDSRGFCYTALYQAAPASTWGGAGTGNASVTNPKPFRLARMANCAMGLSVTIGHTRGVVHTLSMRLSDLRAGHDANYASTRLISELRQKANQERSKINRPDF